MFFGTSTLRYSTVLLFAVLLGGVAGCSSADVEPAGEASQDDIRGSLSGQRARDVARAYRKAKKQDLKPIILNELPWFAKDDVDKWSTLLKRTGIYQFATSLGEFYLVEFAFEDGTPLIYFYDRKLERTLMSLSGDKEFTVIGSNETFEME